MGLLTAQVVLRRHRDEAKPIELLELMSTVFVTTILVTTILVTTIGELVSRTSYILELELVQRVVYAF